MLSKLPVVTGAMLLQAGPSAVCPARTSAHSLKSWYFACSWRCYGAFAVGGIVGRIDPTQEPRVPALGVPPGEEAASLLWLLWLESVAGSALRLLGLCLAPSCRTHRPSLL